MKRKWHRAVKSSLWCLGLLVFFQLLLVRWAKETAMAQDIFEAGYEDGSILVETEVLLQQEDGGCVVRAGRNFVAEVRVSARNASLDGQVNILMLNEAGNNVCYSKKVSVSDRESQSVDFLLPMNLKTDALLLSVAGEDGNALLEQVIPLEAVNYGEYLLIGICAEDFSRFDYFRSFGSSLVWMEEKDFAYGAGALDALDVIVAEEAWLERLGSKEHSCLFEWVEEGGMLVLSAAPDKAAEAATLNLGLQSQSILQELITEISTYETERNGFLATNEEIRKQSGVRECYAGDTMIGSLLVNSLSDEMIKLPVREGWEQEKMGAELDGIPAETVWQEGKRIIAVNYPFCLGSVLAFSIPLEVNSSDIYPLFYYRIAQMVRKNIPNRCATRLNMEKYGSDWISNAYLLGYFEQGGTEIKEIRISPYIMVLLLYILIFIPSAFLLLRNCGKSKYFWGVLPALSFVMVFVIYEMGSSTRIEEPYCSYLNVVDYTGKTGRGTLNFRLSAPTNEGTQITLGKQAFVRLEETNFFAHNPLWYSEVLPAENILKSREYKAAITTSDMETAIELKETPAFSQTSFQVVYKAEEMGGIEGEVTVASECLDGSISNQTGIDFEEVYLYSNNIILSVNGLEDQETVELRACDQIYLSSEEDWYDEQLFTGMFGEKPFAGEEGAVLNFIYDYVSGRDKQGNYAFTVPVGESGLNPLGEVAENPNSYGVEVFIYFVETEEKDAAD